MCSLVCLFSRVFCVILWIHVDVSANARLGCYRDNWQKQRPLHHLLFTDREESSPKYSGIKYAKDIYDGRYLDYLIKRCALECKKFGYKVFGIEKFADCYSGDGGLSTYKKDGPARECFTSNYKPCDLTCESQPCAGRNDTIFVYKLGEPSETSSTPCFPPIKTTPLTITPTTPITKPTPTKPPAKTAAHTNKGTSEGTGKATRPTRRTAGTSPSQPRSVATKRTSSRLASSKATIPVTKFTKATTGTTLRSASPSSVSTRLTQPKISTQTTNTSPTSKGTVSVTKLTTSSNPGRTPGATTIEISGTYPTKSPGISCCMQHPPSTLSQQYHGIYSSPVLPLQSVYTNHCPSPCPSSCAPMCSPKCCNAIIYRSQLYLKRKVIGRKSVTKKSKLRKLGKLHQLKAIKLSQN